MRDRGPTGALSGWRAPGSVWPCGTRSLPLTSQEDREGQRLRMLLWFSLGCPGDSWSKKPQNELE